MKLTTASKITLLRILLIPVVLLLMYADFQGHLYLAALVFAVASLSDFLDGYIARHYDQVTNFGKFLDPLADKMLVISVLVVFSEWGLMPTWVTIIVIVREFAVTGLRQVGVEGGLVIAAAWSGKIKAAATMVCIVIMMMPVPAILNTLCWAIILVTTVYSGIEYFVKNAAVFTK